jgi:hypothetical protein
MSTIPMTGWLERFARSTNVAIAVLGRTLPGMLLALLKLNLVLVFLWYASELAREAYKRSAVGASLVLVSVALLLAFGGWTFVAHWLAEWKAAPGLRDRGPFGPYLVLLLVPVLIVVIASRFGPAKFELPLVRWTAERSDSIVKWFADL